MIQAGFAQFRPARCDVAQNIALVEALLGGVRANLLVLPELANSGYLYPDPAALAPYAEPGDGSGPFLSALIGLAKRTGGLIVAGFAETAAEGLYNSAAAVDCQGVRQVYRKTHLFAAESDLFLPGNTGLRVLDYDGVRIGMMICFDWFFPEAARTLALRGAQILAHPSNLVMPWCQQSMVTRSLENAVFSITANRYGSETLESGQALKFTGGSQMLGRLGERLLAAPEAGDCVAVAEIDPSIADDKSTPPRNDRFRDRRPELYA